MKAQEIRNDGIKPASNLFFRYFKLEELSQ